MRAMGPAVSGAATPHNQKLTAYAGWEQEELSRRQLNDQRDVFGTDHRRCASQSQWSR